MTDRPHTPRPKIPPPVIAFAAGVIIAMVDRLLPGLGWSFAGHKALGMIIAGLGVGIAFAAALAFRRHQTTIDPHRPDRASTVVTDGVYRFTRNPMYLGLALVLAGFSVGVGAPLGLLVTLGFCWVITEVQIKPEETALSTHLGPAYDAYRARVRRWV